MSSMPGSNEINQRINDKSAETWECPRPDCTEHFIGDPCPRLPGAIAELRAAAVNALAAWTVDSPEQAAQLLQSWRRWPEMLDADVAAVLEAMFPVTTVTVDGPRTRELREFARRAADAGFDIDPGASVGELTDRVNALLAEGVPTVDESTWEDWPTSCPTWCTRRHVDDGQFRDCTSEEMFVPQADDKVTMVCVESTFNRATGLYTPEQVRVEDYLFNSKYARHLAQLLVRAADLIDG